MTEQIHHPPILECHQLCKFYGSRPALQGIDLVLPRGRIVGLLGPNGSGKTTLIKLCARLLTPTRGEVLINGYAPSVETKAHVSYLPDKNYLGDWMNIDRLMGLFADFYADFDRHRATEMLHMLGIDPSQRLKSMSKGTQEKVQLILVMSRQSDLYLLDEPIGGIDPAARDYILRTILQNYQEDSTVILSTHLIADVEPVLEEVLFIREGKIVLEESADELRDRTGGSVDAHFREVFRTW